MSLDGFLAGPSDHFDDEVLSFVNNETRKYGTEIYGRRHGLRPTEFACSGHAANGQGFYEFGSRRRHDPSQAQEFLSSSAPAPIPPAPAPIPA